MIETRAASDFRFHLFHWKLPDNKRYKSFIPKELSGTQEALKKQRSKRLGIGTKGISSKLPEHVRSKLSEQLQDLR